MEWPVRAAWIPENTAGIFVRSVLTFPRGGMDSLAPVSGHQDYRDELRQCQPVHHVPEHLFTISPDPFRQQAFRNPL